MMHKQLQSDSLLEDPSALCFRIVLALAVPAGPWYQPQIFQSLCLCLILKRSVGLLLLFLPI